MGRRIDKQIVRCQMVRWLDGLILDGLILDGLILDGLMVKMVSCLDGQLFRWLDSQMVEYEMDEWTNE